MKKKHEFNNDMNISTQTMALRIIFITVGMRFIISDNDTIYHNTHFHDINNIYIYEIDDQRKGNNDLLIHYDNDGFNHFNDAFYHHNFNLYDVKQNHYHHHNLNLQH